MPTATTPVDQPQRSQSQQNDSQPEPTTATPTTSKLRNLITAAFYLAVLAVALVGSAQAAAGKLDWKLPAALAAVSAAELGGVVLSMHADSRRRLGEHAIVARIISAAIAAGAVAINFFGHDNNRFQACFFAGFSALGYTVYLIISAARYRDAQRAANKMVSTPPVYSPWQWIRHPKITTDARRRAIKNPQLGTVASLEAARNAAQVAARRAAIATALRAKIATRVGPTYADIATLTYDMDRVAQLLADRADYNGLTDLIATELTAERITPVADVAPAVATPAAELVATPAATRPTSRKATRTKSRRRPQRKPATAPAATVATPRPGPVATPTEAPTASPAEPVATPAVDHVADPVATGDDDLMNIVRPLVATARNKGRNAPGQRAVYDAIRNARNGVGIGYPAVQDLIDRAIAEAAQPEETR
jgi:hypothetical protein